MSDAYRIVLMPRVLRDLEELHAYIAEDSVVEADRMVERILDAMEGLREFPRRAVAEIYNSRLAYPARFIVEKPYLIFFRVLEPDKVVRVLHVRHGARKRPKRL